MLAFEKTWIKAQTESYQSYDFRLNSLPHSDYPEPMSQKNGGEDDNNTTCDVRRGGVPGRRRQRWRLHISRFARPTRTFIPERPPVRRTAWIIRSDVRRRAPASPGVLWPFDKLRISAKGIIYVCECAADSCPSAHRHRPPVDPNVPRRIHNANTQAGRRTYMYIPVLFISRPPPLAARLCRGGSCPVSRT